MKKLLSIVICLLIAASAVVAQKRFVMLDKVVAAPSDSDSSYTQEATTEDLPIDFFGNSGESAGTETTTRRFQSNSNKDVTANFKFGTVSGTTYFSEFSGVSFKAPAGWSVSSYSGSQYVNLLSPKDMSASSGDMTETVIISYKAKNSHLYDDVRDALSTQIRMANNGSNSMLDDSVTADFGGNKFTGILYKKSSDFYTGYIQVIVAEVNGYVMEIYTESDTQEELETVLEMFT